MYAIHGPSPFQASTLEQFLISGTRLTTGAKVNKSKIGQTGPSCAKCHYVHMSVFECQNPWVVYTYKNVWKK